MNTGMTQEGRRTHAGRGGRRWLRGSAAACFTLILGGCTSSRILLTHPDAFQTGRTLNRGLGELELHTYGVSPYFASAGLGVGDGWDVRGGAGLIGHLLAAQLGVTSSFIRTERWFATGALGFEALAPDSALHFAGYRISNTYAAGFFPAPSFGVYLPLKVSVTDVLPNSFPRDSVLEEYANSAFVPGLGFCYEYEHFTIRVAGNWPIEIWRPNPDIRLAPYLGLQLGYHFRLF